MTLPFISCLCPTWRRPDLLANSIACFEAQDYPKDRCGLVIIDDAGQLKTKASDASPLAEKTIERFPNTAFAGSSNWGIFSLKNRYSSLGKKYNALAGLAIAANSTKEDPELGSEVLAVWEDDDIYLPHHLKTIARNIEGRPWTKPSHVRSLYTGHNAIEPAAGRFHASLAMTRKSFELVKGWPETTAPNFDQQLMSALAILTGAYGVYQTDNPSYVFRWGSTGAYHGQALGDDWWEKAANEGDMRPGPIDVVPKFDEETISVYRELGYV